MKKNLKKPVSFRISAEAAELVRRVAEETGRSEGDIVDQCISAMAQSVLESVRLRRRVLGDAATVAGLAQVVRESDPLPTSQPARRVKQPAGLTHRKETKVIGGNQ